MGGAMSICDLLSVLYGKRMKVCPEDPSFEDRDWLICSKGHAGPAVYVALALKGFFPKEWLYTLNQPGTRLPSHCDARKTPGIMAAYNGGTHMPFEDVAVLRAFPGMIIVEPTDHVMLKDLVKQLAKKKGIYYIRCARKNVTKIYEEGSEFEIGKGNIVKDGMDDSRLIIQSEHADEKGHTCSEGTCGKLRAEGTVEHATAIRNITSNRTIGSEAGFSNLTIRGGKDCAGIGGGRATPADGIYITGGTVYASGGALRSRQSRILRWINILLWLFRPVPG